MRDATIARNYAETLLTLAERSDKADPRAARAAWGDLIFSVGSAIRSDARLQHFLESPKISAGEKSKLIEKAFGKNSSRLFVRYLQMLVAKRRQMLIPEIAEEYRTLLDASEGRVHANVTVAKQPAEKDEERMGEQLSRIVGKRVVPHFVVNPAILGGLIVRIGDTVMDGSVRRKLATLRSRIGTERAL